MGLTELLKQGKQVGMALLMAGSLSCVPRSLQPPKFQVKDDYQAYPKHRKGIALYNIQNILQENCAESSRVDETGFSCEYSVLIGTSPPKVQIFTDSFNWDEIQTTGVKQHDQRYSCLKVNEGCGITFIRNDQVWALKKAIDIYLQETRNKAAPNQPTYLK